MLIKLSIWLCLEVRVQEEVTVNRLLIVHLKEWNSSNIWELITILFRKKLRKDLSQGMVAIIWSGISCLLICYPKM